MPKKITFEKKQNQTLAICHKILKKIPYKVYEVSFENIINQIKKYL